MGTLILYSVMIGLAATSIWLGRNQSLYDFWFYITNFSRYPMEIYEGAFGSPLRFVVHLPHSDPGGDQRPRRHARQAAVGDELAAGGVRRRSRRSPVWPSAGGSFSGR